MLIKVSIPILNRNGNGVSNQDIYFDCPDGIPPTKDEVLLHLQEVIVNNTVYPNAIIDWFEASSREEVIRIAKEAIKSLNAPGSCGYDKWPGLNGYKYIEREDLKHCCISIRSIPVKILVRK